MKKEAEFTVAGQSLSIHATDDQLREVVEKEAEKGGASVEELFEKAKHTRDVTYNATASVNSDRHRW